MAEPDGKGNAQELRLRRLPDDGNPIIDLPQKKDTLLRQPRPPTMPACTMIPWLYLVELALWTYPLPRVQMLHRMIPLGHGHQKQGGIGGSENSSRSQQRSSISHRELRSSPTQPSEHTSRATTDDAASRTTTQAPSQENVGDNWHGMPTAQEFTTEEVR